MIYNYEMIVDVEDTFTACSVGPTSVHIMYVFLEMFTSMSRSAAKACARSQ